MSKFKMYVRNINFVLDFLNSIWYTFHQRPIPLIDGSQGTGQARDPGT
jgi:hypothetical protein